MKKINIVKALFLTPLVSFCGFSISCNHEKTTILQIISPSETTIVAETKADYSSLAIFKNFSYTGDLILSDITVTTSFNIGIARFIPQINNLDKDKKTFDLSIEVIAAPETYNVEGTIQFFNQGKLIEYDSPIFTINFVPQKTIVLPINTEASAVIMDETKPTEVIFPGFSYTNIDDLSKLSVKNNFKLGDSEFTSSIIPKESNNFDVAIRITSPSSSVAPIRGILQFYYEDVLVSLQEVKQFTINLLDKPKIVETNEQTQIIDMYFNEEKYSYNGACKFSGFISTGIIDWSKLTVTSDFAFLDYYSLTPEITDIDDTSNSFSIKVKLESKVLQPQEFPNTPLSSKFKFYYEDHLLYETKNEYKISVIYPIFQKYLKYERIGNQCCLKGFSEVEIEEKNIKKQNAIRIPYDVTSIDIDAFNYEELDTIHKKVMDNIFYLDISNAILLKTIKSRAFKNESQITQFETLPSSLTKIESEAFYGTTINKNLLLPFNLCYVQTKAFAHQENLQRVTFNKNCFADESLFDNDCESIFEGCNNLNEINLIEYGDNIPEIFKQINNNILSGITTRGKIYVSASSDAILAEWEKYIFGDETNGYMSLSREWQLENTYKLN